MLHLVTLLSYLLALVSHLVALVSYLMVLVVSGGLSGGPVVLFCGPSVSSDGPVVLSAGPSLSYSDPDIASGGPVGLSIVLVSGVVACLVGVSWWSVWWSWCLSWWPWCLIWWSWWSVWWSWWFVWLLWLCLVLVVSSGQTVLGGLGIKFAKCAWGLMASSSQVCLGAYGCFI